MKRIISFALFIALLAMPAQLAFASAEIDYSVLYDVEADSFSVSGTVDAGRANVELTLMIKAPDGSVAGGYETIATRNDEDDVEFDFDGIKLPYDASEGLYTFIVSGGGYTAAEAETYPYLSMDGKRLFLEAINDLIEGGGEGLCEKMAEKAKEFGLDGQALSALDGDAVSVLEAEMIKNSYTLPEGVTSDADVEKVLSQSKVYKENADIAIAMGAFSNIKDSASLKAWYNEYYKELELDKDDAETTENEAEIDKYTEDVLSKAAFAERVAAINEVDSLDDLKTKLYEAVLLSAVETLHYGTTYTIINDFPGLFDIDKVELDKLNSTEQGKIYEAVANKHYENYAALVDAFDKKVREATGAEDDDDDSDNWGGGGTTGSRPVASVGTGTTGTESAGTTQKFEDISDVPWAEEAILALAEVGVINGKADKIFAPNDFVTRAEFVKILIGALGKGGVWGQSSFADVDASAWYSSYVAAAEGMGLVLGDDENNFNPDDTITRQDMAVILYRAFKPQTENSAVVFDDAEDISDYAAEAVNVLSAVGAVNGTGNNMFSPLQNATRAQAAVMIYNMIK